MIAILAEDTDFEPSSPYLFRPSQCGSGDVLSETDLHYMVFRSYVTLALSSTCVIGPRRLVPLFDFLVCVARLITALRADRAYTLTFTEAADVVEFRPVTGDRVEVAAIDPYRCDDHGIRLADPEPDCLDQVDRPELLEALTGFLSYGRQQLLDNVPRLDRSLYIGKLFVQE
ncbi:hypothetical protein [Micromonospora sp. NPDC023633]|uniref:hypothetical protein n=1 Tax=Micromonospora sp. NPDC023633 TaxID=3154320 RepID=UPI003408FFEC